MTRVARLAVVLAAAGLSASATAQPVPQAAYASVRLEGAEAPGALAAASASRTAAQPDDWVARDKALHLGASFLLTLSGQYVLTDKAGVSNGRALPVAAGAALALGVLKEAADGRRARDPHFCWRDLAADALGVALAAAVIGL